MLEDQLQVLIYRNSNNSEENSILVLLNKVDQAINNQVQELNGQPIMFNREYKIRTMIYTVDLNTFDFALFRQFIEEIF